MTEPTHNDQCAACGHSRWLHLEYDYDGETDICCECEEFVTADRKFMIETELPVKSESLGN